MKENKLADLSMDFSVLIINLVKELKAKKSIISNQHVNHRSGEIIVLETQI